jgi:hypothetical protein
MNIVDLKWRASKKLSFYYLSFSKTGTLFLNIEFDDFLQMLYSIKSK